MIELKLFFLIKTKMSDTTHTYKILTIGESGVGKTCILRRFVENKFLKNHLATIGIDFKTKNIKVNDIEIKLKIWDTAGQERFRNITNQYYKGADGIVLVFDLTDMNTFDKINDWVSQITSNTKEDEICLVLLGNKCDSDQRNVSDEYGINKAKELGIRYFETSALNGTNINEAFNYLTERIMEKKGIKDDQNIRGEQLGGKTRSQRQRRDCC